MRGLGRGGSGDIGCRVVRVHRFGVASYETYNEMTG